jgi:hypothetical protein
MDRFHDFLKYVIENDCVYKGEQTIRNLAEHLDEKEKAKVARYILKTVGKRPHDRQRKYLKRTTKLFEQHPLKHFVVDGKRTTNSTYVNLLESCAES